MLETMIIGGALAVACYITAKLASIFVWRHELRAWIRIQRVAKSNNIELDDAFIEHFGEFILFMERGGLDDLLQGRTPNEVYTHIALRLSDDEVIEFIDLVKEGAGRRNVGC